MNCLGRTSPIIKLRARVGSDRRVVLDLPADIPEGEIEITICPVSAQEPTGPKSLKDRSEEFDRLPLPNTRRTTEEIDRDSAEERASWD